VNPRQNASVETGKQSRGAFHEWQMAEGHADERSCGGLADLRYLQRPRLALSALQYSLLACALFGFVGSTAMYATGK
jgi:hypothetical protein